MIRGKLYMYCSAYRNMDVAIYMKYVMKKEVVIISYSGAILRRAKVLGFNTCSIEKYISIIKYKNLIFNPLALINRAIKLRECIIYLNDVVGDGSLIFATEAYDYEGLEILFRLKKNISTYFIDEDEGDIGGVAKLTKAKNLKSQLVKYLFDFLYSYRCIFKKKFGDEGALYVNHEFHEGITRLNYSIKDIVTAKNNFYANIKLNKKIKALFIGDYSYKDLINYYDGKDLNILFYRIKNLIPDIQYKPKILTFDPYFKDWKMVDGDYPAEVYINNSEYIFCLTTSLQSYSMKNRMYSVANLVRHKDVVDEYITMMRLKDINIIESYSEFERICDKIN